MEGVQKLICLLISISMCSFVLEAKDKQSVNIVFVGNSITFGAGLKNPVHDAPPVKAALYLSKQPEIASVKYANRGVSGATTVDFLPATESLFPAVVRAADKFKNETWATLLFSITLGTNDSAIKGTNGCPVSPAQYYDNIRIIVDKLLTLYPSCKIVLNRPLWYSPNTYNGAMYLQEGLDRLQSYYPELQALVADYAKRYPDQVYLGDIEAFDYFKTHYQIDCQAEEGNEGVFYLHPNEKGAAVLGQFWGKAIQKTIKH